MDFGKIKLVNCSVQSYVVSREVVAFLLDSESLAIGATPTHFFFPNYINIELLTKSDSCMQIWYAVSIFVQFFILRSSKLGRVITNKKYKILQ